MNATEAATEVARQIVVSAGNRTINRMMVSEVMSEMSSGYMGSWYREASDLANHKTVLRFAIRMNREQS